MANTTKLKPRRVNSFNEPSEGKNLGYKNDDQFNWQDGGGGGKQSYFKTQAEYDALPASKESDGNLYIIVDSHLMPFAKLIQLTPAPDAILAELNKGSKAHAEYYYENGNIEMQKMPSSQLPRADAYVKSYGFLIENSIYYQWIDTNLTEQELINMGVAQDDIEAALSRKWHVIQ